MLVVLCLAPTEPLKFHEKNACVDRPSKFQTGVPDEFESKGNGSLLDCVTHVIKLVPMALSMTVMTLERELPLFWLYFSVSPTYCTVRTLGEALSRVESSRVDRLLVADRHVAEGLCSTTGNNNSRQ